MLCYIIIPTLRRGEKIFANTLWYDEQKNALN